MAYEFPSLEVAHLSHRLDIISRAPDLPASVQFDIARMDLPPSAVDQAARLFGAPERKDWGLTTVLEQMLQQEPQSVTVKDLAQYQQNLVRAGYMPPDTSTDGIWGSEWTAASKRFEQDNRGKFYEGHSPGAISIWSALSALGWIWPSKVFQGIVGTAKGIVEQTPETVERVGALGGAAGGAAIGAAAGSVLPGAGTAAGALIGAGIGAAAGFLGDLFHHDDEEKQQSLAAGIADALTPFEEYSGKGGAQKFFEDLGLVASATGMILGGGAAVKGAAAGIGAITSGAAEAETSGLSFALAKAGPAENVGWMSKILGWSTKKLAGEDAYTGLMNFVKSSGLMAQAQRPLISKLAVPAFTGLSKAAAGGRIASGISSIGAGKETTLEKAMRTAPLPRTGIELPLVGDLIDLPGFVVWPTGFLPWKLGNMARGVSSMLGDTSLKPVVEWVRYLDKGLSHDQAVAKAQEILGSSPAERVSTLISMHLNHGIDMEAAKLLEKGRLERWSEDFESSLDLAKYRIRDQIIEEVGSRDVLASAAQAFKEAGQGKKESVLQRVMSYAYNDPIDPSKGPASFQAYLTRLTTAGTGPDRAGAYFEVSDAMRAATESYHRGEIPLVGMDGRTIVPPKVQSARLERAFLKSEIQKAERELESRRTEVLFHETDPTISVAESARIREDEQRLQALRDLYKSLNKARPRTETDYAIIPQRRDTPTRESLQSAAEKYKSLRERVINTHLEENSGAHMIAKEELKDFLLKWEDVIPSRMLESARDSSSPKTDIAKHLIAKSKGAAQELKLDDSTMAFLAERDFKPVLAHANNLDFHVDPRITEILGLGDYTRRASFYESLGLGLSKDSNEAIASLKHAVMENEVAQTAGELGLPLSSRRIMTRLYRALKEVNYSGLVDNATARSLAPWDKAATESFHWGPFILARDKSGKIVARMFAADLRELKVDDVYEALRDIPEMDFAKALKIHGAIMRGQAMGADLSFLHPIQAANDIARNMRISGLPGMADVIRTWHTEFPGRMPSDIDGHPNRVEYPIPEDLIGAERHRWEKDFRAAAINVGLDSYQERTMLITMDAMAHGAMAAYPEIYPDADSFFRRLDVGFAEEYAKAGEDELFRVVAHPAPNLVEVDQLGKIKPGEVEPGTFVVGHPNYRFEEGRPVGRVESVRTEDLQPTQGFTESRQVEQYSKLPPGEAPFIVADRFPDGHLEIRDGHHRYIAAQNRGEERMNAVVFDVDAAGRPARFFNDHEINTLFRRSTQARFPQFNKNGTVRETSMARLQKLMDAHREDPRWYAEGNAGIRAAYGGRKVRINGEDVPLDDLMTRVIAVTSGGQQPKPNLTVAQKALDKFLEDPTHIFTRADGIMGRDDPKILNRIFHRGYIPDTDKFGPFYRALRGDPNAVVMDRRMAGMFGYLERVFNAAKGKHEWKVTWSQKEKLQAEGIVRDLAKRAGIEPATAQERLWVGFREWADEQGRILRKKGDPVAEVYEAMAKGATDDTNFGQLLADPKYADRATKAVQNVARGWSEVAKRVEDEILGVTQFGPDYAVSMRFFRSADLTTITHEFGHLLRRLLPPDQAEIIERAFGATQTAGEFAHTRESVVRAAARMGGEEAQLTPITETAARKLYESAKEGGFTYNPRTGKLYTTKRGYGVSVMPETAAKLPEDVSFEEFRRKLETFQEHYAPLLRKGRSHIGAWLEEGQIHLDTSEVIGRKTEAMRAAEARRQKGVFDFKTRETHAVDESKFAPVPAEMAFSRPGVEWTPDAEERFAEVVEKYLSHNMADPKIRGALEALRTSLGHLWSRYRGRALDRNLIPPDAFDVLERWFGDVWKATKPTVGARGTLGLKPVAAATAGGAALGAIESDDKLHGALLGAEYGLVMGLGTRYLLRKSYGYLPDYLARVAGALRYSLSPSFDVRRFTKQGLLAGAKYDLPYFGNARRYISAKYGEQAWGDALKLLDEVHGARYFETLDSFDRTLYQGGILGYSPLLRQAAHAFMLREKGKSVEEIRTALAELYQYGHGRTALEKSINFVFFPFSFEKKLITTVGDALLQAPARALLIHEALIRYHDSKASKEVSQFLDDHVPLLSKLQEFNAFSHGISPGRFLFEGMLGPDAERTGAGKVSQVLANFFIPAGASVSPIHRMVGGFGDLAIHAFSPIVVTGESVTRRGADLTSGRGFEQVRSLLQDYIPFMQDLTELYRHAADQMTAMAEGESKYSQLHDYADELRGYKDALEPIAQSLGYASTDGLLQSNLGQSSFKPAYDEHVYNLRSKYPTGFQTLSQYQDTNVIAKQALGDLMHKGSLRTAAEDAIVNIAQQESTWKTLSDMGALPSELTSTLGAQQARQIALAHANDPRFVELWNELYAWKYGPVKVVA